MSMNVLYACKAGDNATRTGRDCQDYAAGFVDRERKIGVAVLADGAGSYTHSAAGAKAAAEAVLTYFREHDTLTDRLAFVRRINAAVAAVDPVGSDVGTTLLFAAVTADGFVAGHIGDGVILSRRDGQFSVLSYPENGEYVWETYLLPCEENSRHFRFYEGTDAADFLLASDGVAPLLYDEEGRGCPACEKLYQWSGQMTREEFRRTLEEHFGGVFAKYSDDDKSLAILHS